MFNKLITFLILSITTLFAQEVSAFGAGNLSSSAPYGLTSAEQHILKNKNMLDNFDTNVKSVKSSLDMLSERIDGLESIFEGDSRKLHSTTNKLTKFLEIQTSNTSQIKTNTTQLDNTKEVIEQIVNEQSQLILNQENFKNNIDILKKSIDSLTVLVNKINSVYVSQNELESNMKQFVTQKEFDKLILLLDRKGKALKKSSKSDKSLLEEARRLFKKDNFTKAIPIYEELIRKSYRPAESNFTLGEIWYYRKKYKSAIAYFKKSAILYDKAKYMPKLLLHSAISFERIKDLDNAASFYNTLIDMYPNSKEAKSAQKILSQE